MPKKILLADDSITIQKVISITFSGEDYQLQIVSDGEEAVSRAKSMQPDLVMVDVAMPGKNGYEVCEAIKKDQATSSTPVMLLAGTFEPLDKGEAERVGADDHIVKPFESQELIDKVNKLLSAAGPVSAQAPAEAGAEGEAFDISEEMWEEGDFLGFSEDFGPDSEAGKAPEFTAPSAEETGSEPSFDLGYANEEVFSAAGEESGETAGGGEFVDLEFTTDELSADQLGASGEAGFAEEAPAPETAEPTGVEPAAETPSFEEPAGEPVLGETTFGEPAAETPSEEPIFEEPSFEAPAAEQAPEAEHFGIGSDTVVWGGEEEKVPETPEAEPVLGEPEAGPETGIEDLGEGVIEEPAEPAPSEPVSAPEQPPVSEPAERPLRVVGSEAAEKVAREAAEAVTERLGDKLDIPPGKVEEIVAKVAREVVEEIAWEVVPELAEELITKELDKVRTAFGKLK